MDRSYIDSNHILERYLAGQLSDDETEAFEVYCLEHPEVADDLEYARTLKAQLRIDESALVPDQAVGNSWLRSPAYAVAASVVAIVGLGTTAFFANRPTFDSQTAGVIADEFVLESMRGSTPSEFEIRDGVGTVLLHIDLGPDSTPPYEVRITRGSESLLAQQSVVPIGSLSVLTVWLTEPKPGEHEISVTDAEGAQHIYPIQLKASD